VRAVGCQLRDLRLRARLEQHRGALAEAQRYLSWVGADQRAHVAGLAEGHHLAGELFFREQEEERDQGRRYSRDQPQRSRQPLARLWGAPCRPLCCLKEARSRALQIRAGGAAARVALVLLLSDL